MNATLAATILAGLGAGHAPDARPAPRHVVFVCEHGSVKSLIAMAWFNRLAKRRGLAVRARSRGMMPDSSVPPAIVEKLRRDGLDVSSYEPRALSKRDLHRAARLVAIGVDTSPVTAGAVAAESWNEIPPATERYDESRDALKARIETLLSSLDE